MVSLEIKLCVFGLPECVNRGPNLVTDLFLIFFENSNNSPHLIGELRKPKKVPVYPSPCEKIGDLDLVPYIIGKEYLGIRKSESKFSKSQKTSSLLLLSDT